MNYITDNFFDKFNKYEKRAPIDEGDNKVLILNGSVNEKMYNTFLHMYSQCDVDDNIVVELTTKGGEVTYAYMISQILLKHKGYTVVRVPRFAMSAGTIIALSANKIVLSHCGCLGPIDPYILGLNVPTSTSVLKEYNSRSESVCNSLISLVTFRWINWGIMNLITNYCERMLGKINDDHARMVSKLLFIYKDGADDIYDFFTHSSHHGTPIYFGDIPDELKLNIEEDDGLLGRLYERDNISFNIPKKANSGGSLDGAIDMYAGVMKELFKKSNNTKPSHNPFEGMLPKPYEKCPLPAKRAKYEDIFSNDCGGLDLSDSDTDGREPRPSPIPYMNSENAKNIFGKDCRMGDGVGFDESEGGYA